MVDLDSAWFLTSGWGRPSLIVINFDKPTVFGPYLKSANLDVILHITTSLWYYDINVSLKSRWRATLTMLDSFLITSPLPVAPWAPPLPVRKWKSQVTGHPIIEVSKGLTSLHLKLQCVSMCPFAAPKLSKAGANHQLPTVQPWQISPLSRRMVSRGHDPLTLSCFLVLIWVHFCRGTSWNYRISQNYPAEWSEQNDGIWD